MKNDLRTPNQEGGPRPCATLIVSLFFVNEGNDREWDKGTVPCAL